ncbi:MAG: dihydrolipoyl dehydrogenase [Candidatus Thermoplasmatota archaeon]
MKKIVVLGGGIGGYVSAIRASQLGGEVTLIEEKEIGGTCLNVGCIPAKLFLSAARNYISMKNANNFGLSINDISFDMKKLVERKNKVVEELRNGIMHLLKKNKVRYINGSGKIVSSDCVSVKNEKINMDATIIATGSSVAELKDIQIDHDKIISSNDAFELRELPKEIIIVGGGAIGVEFACFFNSFGTKVTIIEILPNLLPQEDGAISKILEREMKKRGIEVITNGFIEKIGKKDNLEVDVKNFGKIKAEKLLLCVGRIPNTKDIGLENVGIKTNNGWIEVNEKMETNVKNFYAIGDVVGGKLLANKAIAEGLVAASNLLGIDKKIEKNLIPNAIFSIPEIGSVGLTEENALKLGYKIKTGRFPFRALGRARADGKIEGEVKVIADENTKKIIGLHIIGEHATELIGIGVTAMKFGAKIDELDSLFSHPTYSEAIEEAFWDLEKRAIHW